MYTWGIGLLVDKSFKRKCVYKIVYKFLFENSIYKYRHYIHLVISNETPQILIFMLTTTCIDYLYNQVFILFSQLSDGTDI